MNHIELLGRLTRDPEMKASTGGIMFARFTLAINRQTNGKEEADFINCVAFNKTAQAICNFVRRGNRLLVEGRLQQRKYTDRNGENRSVFEVVVSHAEFIETRQSAGQAPADGQLPQGVSPSGALDSFEDSINQRNGFTSQQEEQANNEEIPF